MIELIPSEDMEGVGRAPEAGKAETPELVRADDLGPLPPIPGAMVLLWPVPDMRTALAEVERGAFPEARRGDDTESIRVEGPGALPPVPGARLLLGPVTDKPASPAAVKGGGVPDAGKGDDFGLTSARLPLWPIPVTSTLAWGLLGPEVIVGKPLPAMLPGVLVGLVTRVELPDSLEGFSASCKVPVFLNGATLLL